MRIEEEVLRDAEMKWDDSEMECLAIVEGVKAYHVCPANNKCSVIADRMPLSYRQHINRAHVG